MPAQESGGMSFEEPRALSEQDLLARLQELVDTRPTEGNCPVEWAVPAYFLGDMDALAVLSFRFGN